MSPVELLKPILKWAVILFVIWKISEFSYWTFFSPEPIVDWVESQTTITSPSNSNILLTKLRPWTIYGAVLYQTRIIDPILPTLGKYPESTISPADVLLGCGRLLKPEVFHTIKAHHDFRTANVFGIEGPEEVAHEHIITSNYLILKEILALKKGDLVQLTGDIVDIKVDERLYRTSDSRSDENSTARGGGACEILFVRSVENKGKIN